MSFQHFPRLAVYTHTQNKLAFFFDSAFMLDFFVGNPYNGGVAGVVLLFRAWPIAICYPAVQKSGGLTAIRAVGSCFVLRCRPRRASWIEFLAEILAG